MRRRFLGVLLTVCMLASMFPAGAWAAEVYNGGLCLHHEEHNDACGYMAADEGTPCAHEHTGDCFAPVENCVHEHDETCCGDGALPDKGEDNGAGLCTHVCTGDSGCVTLAEACAHTHDEACGYVKPTEGAPCGFICEICEGTQEQAADIEAAEDLANGAEAYSAAEPDAAAVKAAVRTIDDLEGSGTEDDPYKISTKEDLLAIADAVNNENTLQGVYFKQTGDIDLACDEDDPWPVIGHVVSRTPHPFSGVYDGGDWKIYGLYVNATEEDAGLFGNLSKGGVICRVHVVDCRVYSKALYVGGIVGRSEGLVEYCSSDLSPDAAGGSGDDSGDGDDADDEDELTPGSITGAWQYTGGIVGYNFGVISYCYSNCDVFGAQKAGGITGGQNGGTVVNCYFRGYVYASDITRGYAGGIAGENDGNSTIRNCYCDGIVEGSNENLYCGAIAGSNDTGSTVENCFWEDGDDTDFPGIASGSGDVKKVEKRTPEEFDSGQVAWELAQGEDGEGWGQTLENDDGDHDGHPHFTEAPDKDYTTTPVYRVTLTTKDIHVTLFVDPNVDLDLDKYPLPNEQSKWYIVDKNGDGVLDDNGEPLLFNGDVKESDVDAVGGERILFAGEAETIIIAGTYNLAQQIIEVDFDDHMGYAARGPADVAGRFEYKITSGNETLQAVLSEDGNTLTIPAGTSVNESGYRLTVTAHEKKPFIAPLSLGNYGDDDVSLAVNVVINKATPDVTWPALNRTVYVNDPALPDSDWIPGSATGVDGAALNGTFTYNGARTWSESGVKNVTYTFAPDDTTNYLSVTNNKIEVNVVKRQVESITVDPTRITDKDFGTQQEALGLPDTVTITTADGKTFENVPVIWSGYDSASLAEQNLIGTLDLKDIQNEVENSNDMTASIMVQLQWLHAGTMEFLDKTETYSGNPVSLEINGGVVGVKGVAYTYEGVDGTAYSASLNAPKNAGTYAVTASFTMDSGYEQISDMAATLTIEPAELTIPACSFTHNGRKTFSFTLNGVNNETVKVTLTTSSADVGSYDYATIASDGKYTASITNTNYIIVDGGTLTIKKGNSAAPAGPDNPADAAKTPDGMQGLNGVPKTGDETNLTLWSCLLGISGSALVTLLRKSRKEEKTTR